MKKFLKSLEKSANTSKTGTSNKGPNVAAVACLLLLPNIEIATANDNSKLLEAMVKHCVMVIA